MRDFSEVLYRTRILLQDTAGDRYSKGELTEYVNAGQAEFARRTKELQGSFYFYKDPFTKEFTLPDDFVSFSHAIDKDNNLVIIEDFLNSDSDAKSELIDLESDYGVISRIINEGDVVGSLVKNSIRIGFSGVGFATDYGVIAQYNDAAFDTDIGAVHMIIEFDETVEMFYYRESKPGMLEVSDPLALVYFAAAKAFEREKEERDLKNAKALYSIFYKRCNKAVKRQNKRRGVRRKLRGNF